MVFNIELFKLNLSIFLVLILYNICIYNICYKNYTDCIIEHCTFVPNWLCK